MVPVDEVRSALLRVGGRAPARLPRAAVSAMSAANARTAGRPRDRGTLLGRPRRPRRLDPALLGEHIDLLYHAARGMCVSRDEAEDLVQDTFAQVLRKPRFLYSDDDIGYLLRVLRNTFVSGRRLAQRRPQDPAVLEGLASIEDRSAVRPEARLDYSELYRAIASLPDGFRDALIAVDVLGLSYGEAARALRVPEATLTTRLHRGRQRVADGLEVDELELGGHALDVSDDSQAAGIR